MPLAKAPKELRAAARLALICSSIAKIVSLAVLTVIIATLPTWVPGLQTLQVVPVALLVLLIGSLTLSRRGGKIRLQVGQQNLKQARSSSLTGAILGFTIGGVLPGPFYLLLYMSIGKAMVRQVPNEAQLTTVYLPSEPSRGIFLGRYLAWLSMYLYVLYTAYTQLPDGLRGVSDWLSPTFGIHMNTLIVAAYLVFSNPIANQSVLMLWLTAGLIGGLIAGGKTGRGASVGTTLVFSTLGAMGLAGLVIFRGFYTNIRSLNIPPFPPNFSITALATGPIAQDLIPIILKPGVSPTDPMVIENVALVLIRNLGLVLMAVTVAGRAGCLLWQGVVYALKPVARAARGNRNSAASKTPTKKGDAIAEAPTIKTAVVLLVIAMGLAFPSFVHGAGAPSQVQHANSSSNPFQQVLTVGFDRLGSPNASLRVANLDLSGSGIVLDSNYDRANFTMLIINNDYPQGFGSGANNFPLQLFSKPALVTMYSSDQSTALAKSNGVAAQFSTALGTQFNYALSMPTGGSGWINLYGADSSISNSDMLAKVLAILPAGGFSGLFNVDQLKGQKYSAMLGLVPGGLSGFGNVTLARSFGLMLNAEFPRQFFKEGPHQFSLAGLLGSTANIAGTASSNSSVIAVSFQPGTTVSSYTPLSSSTRYDPFTYTLLVNATSAFTTPDLTATFTYAFAPDITFAKTVSPASGSVGDSYTITLSVQNLDNVALSMVNLTDSQAPPVYSGTLLFAPNGVQYIQVASLTPGTTLSTSYRATPKSSGEYSLAQANGEFDWTLSNGTSIRYTMDTDDVVLLSQSGPLVQLTQTYNDLQPYSYLLILSFALPPIIEIVRLFRRRGKPKTNMPYVEQPISQ